MLDAPLMRVGVVDLFCGIGGLSFGFKAEGFDVLAGFDSDRSCKYAYETNVKADFIAADVGSVTGADVRRIFERKKNDYRVLIGCAPCQPFSLYTGRYRKAEPNKRDVRWQLLEEFARLVRMAKPDVVSMENVPRVTLHPVFQGFIKELEHAGYVVSYHKIRAEHYGVPQRRARLVLFASLWGSVDPPVATHLHKPVTVRRAIGSMPRIEAGHAAKTDRLHVSRSLSEKNLLRIKSTAEGGSWKDWDESLQLDCHKTQNGKSFRSVYGRMNWDEPSPVITTQCLGIGNGRFGHPEQNRAISIREASLLQSFPKSFRFVSPQEPVYGLHLARQIGNAVPVKLGRAIARAIKVHLADASALSGAR